MQKCHLAGAVAAVQALSHASLGKEEKEGCMKLAQDMLKDCKSTLSVDCARADAPPAKQLQPFQKHLHSTVGVRAGIPVRFCVVDSSPPSDQQQHVYSQHVVLPQEQLLCSFMESDPCPQRHQPQCDPLAACGFSRAATSHILSPSLQCSSCTWP